MNIRFVNFTVKLMIHEPIYKFTCGPCAAFDGMAQECHIDSSLMITSIQTDVRIFQNFHKIKATFSISPF
jgi:hypothetical protein